MIPDDVFGELRVPAPVVVVVDERGDLAAGLVVGL